MTSAAYNITIEQGSAFELWVSLGESADPPYDDLSGSTLRAVIKATATSATAQLSSALALQSDPISGSPNRVGYWLVTAPQSLALSLGTHWYCIELIPTAGADYTQRILSGTVTVVGGDAP